MVDYHKPYQGGGMEVTWDMRMSWYERLDGLINTMTDFALKKDVPKYLEFMQQLYLHTFFEIDDALNKKDDKDFEEELNKIRENIYDKKILANTKAALEQKKIIYNEAYSKLIQLQKRIMAAMADKKMFIKKTKTYDPGEAILDLE